MDALSLRVCPASGAALFLDVPQGRASPPPSQPAHTRSPMATPADPRVQDKQARAAEAAARLAEVAKGHYCKLDAADADTLVSCAEAPLPPPPPLADCAECWKSFHFAVARAPAARAEVTHAATAARLTTVLQAGTGTADTDLRKAAAKAMVEALRFGLVARDAVLAGALAAHFADICAIEAAKVEAKIPVGTPFVDWLVGRGHMPGLFAVLATTDGVAADVAEGALTRLGELPPLLPHLPAPRPVDVVAGALVLAATTLAPDAPAVVALPGRRAPPPPLPARALRTAAAVATALAHYSVYDVLGCARWLLDVGLAASDDADPVCAAAAIRIVRRVTYATDKQTWYHVTGVTSAHGALRRAKQWAWDAKRAATRSARAADELDAALPHVKASLHFGDPFDDAVKGDGAPRARDRGDRRSREGGRRRLFESGRERRRDSSERPHARAHERSRSRARTSAAARARHPAARARPSATATRTRRAARLCPGLGRPAGSARLRRRRCRRRCCRHLPRPLLSRLLRLRHHRHCPRRRRRRRRSSSRHRSRPRPRHHRRRKLKTTLTPSCRAPTPTASGTSTSWWPGAGAGAPAPCASGCTGWGGRAKSAGRGSRCTTWTTWTR